MYVYTDADNDSHSHSDTDHVLSERIVLYSVGTYIDK